jgi:hypothetical protein
LNIEGQQKVFLFTLHEFKVKRNKKESPKVKNEMSKDFKLGPVNGTISNCESLHLEKELADRQTSLNSCSQSSQPKIKSQHKR